jgi:type II secretory pathway predicted ATPase ExeA
MSAKRTETRLRAAFGFTRLPFAKDLDPDEVFQTPRLERARQQLDYVASRHGIALLASEPGLGKSTLLRVFLDGLGRTTHAKAYLAFSNCATLDIFRQIAHLFGLTPAHRKADLMLQIQQRLLKLSRTQKLKPVLVIDDAHLLTARCLDELRLLTSFDVDARDDLTLVLAGHAQLQAHLALAINEALAQRIIMRIQLRGLTREEVEGYLAFRLARAGRTGQLFEPAAIEAVAVASGGIPRNVDRIAEGALLIALNKKAKSISAEHITQTQEETGP